MPITMLDYGFGIEATFVGLLTAGVTLCIIPFVMAYLENWEVE